jgi:hypothetical protein
MVQSTLSVFKKVLLGVSLLVSLFVVSNSAFAGTGDTKYVCVGQPVSVNWNIANCASPTYIAPSACDPFTPPTAGGAGSSALPYATVDCNLTINACGDSAVASVVVNVPGTWNGSSCQIASPDPTASLKVTAGTYGTNVSTISYPAGTANTKTWSSTNGATYSDRYRLTGSCANNSWNTDTAWKVFGTFTSASGNSNTNAQEGDVGCVRNTDYVVKNGTKSATSSIQETVTRCLDEKYFTAGSGCVACGNSGCTGTGGSVSDPDGSLSCNNGSTIKPACTLNPVIDTPTATAITSTGATLGANFKSAGTKTIVERGTCWGSVVDPLTNCVAEATNAGGVSTGVFSHARGGSMLANTTYHYRGFVRDSGGTYYYSADATFTTTAPSAMSGTLTASPEACTILNGASTCWSLFTWTTTNATSGVSQVIGDGGGPSSNSNNNGSQSLLARYILDIPGAQYPKPHIFRLYNNSKELATVNVTADCASNSAWDGDSCEACQGSGCTNHVCNNGSTIKPACTLNPVIDTPTATAITSTGATLGANFKSAGTKTIVERGTCWGSVVDPLTNCVAEATNAGGVSTGVFSHARGGSMLANTTYHYRGFVRDSGGTYYYSADATFTTTAPSAMSGTLTASPEACTILNGASTCWSLFTWTTTNATSGVSQVIGDGGGPSSNSNNNGSQSLLARYILDIPGAQYPKPHIFRLYNNSKELATVNVTADCASNSAWDGDSCEACQGSGCTNHVCNNGSTIKPACTLNPVIDTPTATAITSTGATLGANFKSAGTKTITERGTCWGSACLQILQVTVWQKEVQQQEYLAMRVEVCWQIPHTTIEGLYETVVEHTTTQQMRRLRQRHPLTHVVQEMELFKILMHNLQEE